MKRSFQGRSPRVHTSAFIHDSAEVVGDVSIGRGASVWPTAVLRGDVNAVRVGERSNLQDGVVVHCREGHPARVGRGVTVGHRAVVHGSKIGDYCLVGMGAVVMEADIGRESLVGAGAVVPPGFKAPARSLILGVPARTVRRLSPREIKSLHESARAYEDLAARHRRTSRAVF